MNPLFFGFMLNRLRGQDSAEAARNAILGQAWKEAIPDPMTRALAQAVVAQSARPQPQPSGNLDAALDRVLTGQNYATVRDAAASVGVLAAGADPATKRRALETLRSAEARCSNRASLTTFPGAVLDIARNAPPDVQEQARGILRGWLGRWTYAGNRSLAQQALAQLGH